MLGAWALVTHVGTRAGSVAETATRVARAIDRARDRAGHPNVRILLENTAGAGRSFGTGPEELGAVVSELAEADAVGVCLDTCHAHAAGWDLAHESEWQRLLEGFRDQCPAPLLAVHANDCLFGSGERKDRHAWIGEGTIGRAGFAAMFRQEALADLPIVTELGGAVPEKDVVNITRLRELRAACEVL
jgi:deoxyribonuclease-4